MAAEFVSTIPTTRSCPYASAPEHPRLREHPEPLVRVKPPDGACVWPVTRQQLAFDFGRHQRLGQDLARLAPPIATDSLFRRIPGPRPPAVTIDHDKFVASGQCVAAAQDVFDPRDDDAAVRPAPAIQIEP